MRAGVSSGRPLVLVGPSGAGKTTIAGELVEGSDDFAFSVSATTRKARAGERDGVDYHFLSPAAFAQLRDQGELVEWATVHGHLYGTPRESLTGAAKQVVLDIDVQGARQIKTALPEARCLFVLPPSAEALVQRLSGRSTEGHEELVGRLKHARKELAAAPEFEGHLVNDDLERAVEASRRWALEGGSAPVVSDLISRVASLRRGIEAILVADYDDPTGSINASDQEES